MMFLQIQQPNIDVPADSVFINKITEGTEKFIKMSWHDKLNTILDGAVDVGLKLIAVIAIYIVGRWIIKKTDKLIDRIFTRRHVDTSINTFVRNMLRIVAYLILIMIMISVLGIKTTSIVAILASAGFAVGMALSGTLQNFAGGVMILLLKPFRTGDYIQAQGYEGTVKEIKLFSTIINTSDNKTIIIPNGGLSSSIINNFSASGTRRVEWSFGINYGDDYNKAKGILQELLEGDNRVLSAPPYFIAMQSLDESAVSIVVRAWTKSGDFWDVYYDMNEKVYKIFPIRGLAIPLNKLDVSLTMADNTKKKPVKNTTDSVKDIVASQNTTKVSDNSVASPDDSHEKLHGKADDADGNI